MNPSHSKCTTDKKPTESNSQNPSVLYLDSIKTEGLSCSAPGAISNLDFTKSYMEEKNYANSNGQYKEDWLHNSDINDAISNKTNEEDERTCLQESPNRLGIFNKEDRSSLSNLTTSTEQSVPVHFDMSNRAKLPRGIENIRPHLEQVDNVPLQVSLFTDCSPEATRQMLDIMQSYGEIVVAFGSSASNTNAEIFLQADCSIAVEPLYPQVCQNITAYTDIESMQKDSTLSSSNNQCDMSSVKLCSTETSESNISFGNNTANGRTFQIKQQYPKNRISPIYLSRALNSLPCSITMRRDEPLSLVAIIELSRHFSSGLWNCIQFWACCAGSISALNALVMYISLPPIFTPFMVIYAMCIPVPLIAISLVHIELDQKIMSRATGKKQTQYDSRVFGFVLWCYGCKFITPVASSVIG